MDPITLVLINAGVSALNSWQNSKQAKKLQKKQQEFALAAAERNRQRMWNSMREGQSLMMEIEQENHEIRLREITDEFDNILKRLAYTEAIKVWPLKVLPIVMKNQSLGNLMINKDENIAMHCILTPSNCESFNTHIFPIIEQQISSFCNSHWNSLSSHPILFYSGAWKSNLAPTGVEIDQLKTNLRSLPTLMITPFFKPEGGLVFNINVWGVGIEIDTTEISCTDFSYSGSYAKGLNYKGDDDLTTTTIEEFVPYLQCLIGYFADQYFWTAHNEAPILPSLLEMNVVNTDGKLFLREASKERYGLLLDIGNKESKEMPFAPEKMLTLLEGSATLWDEQIRKKKLEEIVLTYCNQVTGNSFSKISEIGNDVVWTPNDLAFITLVVNISKQLGEEEKYTLFSEQKAFLDTIDYDYTILDSKDISFLEELSAKGNLVAMFRLGELYEYAMRVDLDLAKSKDFYSKSAESGFFLAKLKIGKESYADLSKEIITILRLMNVLQIDVLYSEYVLNDGLTTAFDECIKQLTETIMSNMSTGRAYSHTGLLLNLATLKIKQKSDLQTAKTLLTLADKLGYKNALKLLFK